MLIKNKCSERAHPHGVFVNRCFHSILVLSFDTHKESFRQLERTLSNLKPIIVYIIDRHPLEVSETGPFFRWLHFDNDFKRELEDLIGPYDPDKLSVLIDEKPAGSRWRTLLDHLLHLVRVVSTQIMLSLKQRIMIEGAHL